MKRLIFFLCLASFFWNVEAQVQRTWCNPVNISYRYSMDGKGYREAADPSMVFYQGKYWLFASKSGGYWWSTDMLAWHFVETHSLPTEDYAPTVMAYGDALYFLASFDSHAPFALYRTHNPMGDQWQKVTDQPFKYPAYANGTKCIDPMLLADGNRVYLYWGCSNKTPTWVVELDPKHDFQAMNVPMVIANSDTTHRGWEHFPDGRKPWVEGSWTNKVNGKYYMQYAVSGTSFDWYSDEFMVSDRPMDGFRFDGHNPFSLKPTGFVRGAGHSSTFSDIKGNYWHIVTNCLSVKNGYERRLSLFPTLFDKDGVPYCCTLWGDYPQRMPTSRFDNPERLFTGWMLLSYHKPAKASSSLPGHEVNLAFDEDMKTYWSSDSQKGGWLETDLGAVESVHAVQVNFADQDADCQGIVRNKGQQYRILVSTDGKNWITAVDKATSLKDAPHDYMELNRPVNARYVKLENIQVPYGKFAVCGFRIFGLGKGKLPAAVRDFEAVRNDKDRKKIAMKWSRQSDATGYVMKYGVAPDKLYQNFIIYGQNDFRTFLLNAEMPYYFSIAAFNDNGVSSYSEITKVK